MIPPADRAPSRALGRAAVVGQIAGAILIAVVASVARANPGVGPPEPVPRGLVLGALFLVPAAIGALGLAGERPAIVAAAGIVAMVDAVVAFSGVTLVFLVPAIMFVASSAGAFEARPATPPDEPARPGHRNRRILAGAAAIPLALFAVLTIGVLAVPLFAALAMIAGARRTSSGAGPQTMSGAMAAIGVGTVVVALAVASIAALFVLTTAECWTAYRTPTGVRYEVAPWPEGETGGTGQAQVADGAIGSGCASGVLSPSGLAAAGALGFAAIGLGAIASRRPPVRARP